MEPSKSFNNNVEYITLVHKVFGFVRIGKQYISKENLKDLFQIDEPLVVDTATANEIKDYKELSPKSSYVIASESDLEEDDEEDEHEHHEHGENCNHDHEEHDHSHDHDHDHHDHDHDHEHHHDENCKHDEEHEHEHEEEEDEHEHCGCGHAHLTPEEMQKRMLQFQRMNIARRNLIKREYSKLHPDLFQFSETFLLPSFVKAIKSGTESDIRALFKKESETGIYSFEMFTPKFCQELIEEVEHFEASGLPLMRPNSMNNYGVILEEMGMDEFFENLLEYVRPFASLLYGKIGAGLDAHHSFIVEYKIGADEDLDFHYDDSEVTINFCLGKEFTGGSLYFNGLLDDPSTHKENFEFNHKAGLGIVHLGKHRHGANKIKSGERFNIIMWFRNIAMRTEGQN